MTEPQLTEVLTSIADRARPARVPDDLWRRGVRRRRVRVAAAAVVSAVVLAGAPFALLHDGGRRALPADAPEPVVPATVYAPWTGEDTIVESPPGPAAILVAGDRELRGSDVWGWEGRSLLIGQNGDYRLARTVGETSAGMLDGLLLSPDGGRLASQPWVEGSHWPDEPRDQTAVVDLTTGEVRQYDGGLPMGWAPDGRSILTSASPNQPGPYRNVGTLGLLDLDTGRTRRLPEIKGAIRGGNVTAFSPDGDRLAVATEEALYVVDLTTDTVAKIHDFTARDRLAGPGAWLPDGTRIATYTVGGCIPEVNPCTESGLARRLFQIRYLDAGTGREVAGPALDPAQGMSARLLGWQRDGGAVVAVHGPERDSIADPGDASWSETDWVAVGDVRLLRFAPGGGQRDLVDLPDSALFVDVPTDLLDRFGGPAPSRLEGRLRWLLALVWPLGLVCEAGVALLLLVAGLRLYRRFRRRRADRRAPAGGDPAVTFDGPTPPAPPAPAE